MYLPYVRKNRKYDLGDSFFFETQSTFVQFGDITSKVNTSYLNNLKIISFVI